MMWVKRCHFLGMQTSRYLPARQELRKAPAGAKIYVHNSRGARRVAREISIFALSLIGFAANSAKNRDIDGERTYYVYGESKTDLDR